MLYPKNREKALSPELFRAPTSEYRSTPFWAWNGRLTKEELARQIGIFRKMGFGGFHMHVRTGMDTSYLTEEFLGFVEFCVNRAREEGMLAWLYDEDRWPSGTAGGRVTAEHPEYARKSLLLTAEPYAPERPHRARGPEPGRGQGCVRQDNGELLAAYDVLLDGDGALRSFRRVGEGDAAQGVKWYAYMERAADDPWFNNRPYVDTLSPEAIAAFIESTHEVYAARVGADFGKTVPAIFTDEPQFTPKNALPFARGRADLFLPWTERAAEIYREKYGEDVLDRLPELVWELPGGRLSPVRWRFQNLIADLFVASFCAQIGSWCDARGLALTGHVMEEPTLRSQTRAVGDAMRCYRPFGIPGIDMLCDFHEYTTAKQCQSIVRQAGKEGMLSELYGVTGWDYDFRGYKLQGDWQAALGVTVRVPHLSWLTMKGEAKRDYPASIGYQSPWWDQYALLEDHFARLNTALTRGRAEVRVAVVHPIESYWLRWGPSDRTAAAREQMERQFRILTETLLLGNIDFDFLNEAELPALCPEGGAPLRVGEMAYDAVIVPPLTTVRSTTLERLDAFRQAGGALISLGDAPALVDAEPSPAAAEAFRGAARVPFDGVAILEALESFRFLDIRREDGTRADTLLCQLRRDGDALWLFICNGVNPVSPDVDDAPLLRFHLRGEFAPEVWDTLTGEVAPLAARREDGRTVFERRWHIHDSLLLRLAPGRPAAFSDAGPQEPAGRAAGPDEPVSRAMGLVDVTLEEPNMLLLDMAEYSLNGGPFQPLEEILRIDNAARAALGIPLRRKEVVQPYLLAPEEPRDRLTLRFSIPSEAGVSGAKLALEDRAETRVVWNGEEVAARADGWFVDKCIETVPLPPIREGMNLLEVTVPVGRRTNLECLYLLGDFGVRVNGVVKTVTAPVRRIGFGDIVPQGLPFYTGNLLYRLRVRCEGDFTVRVPRWRGGLVRVFVDGEDAGPIAFSPYAMRVCAAPGEHEVAIRLYGTRQNGFAQLHHTPGVYFYQSPNSWRSAGDMWCCEYQFKSAGVLKSPEFTGAAVLDGDGGARVSAPAGHMTDLS